MRLRKTDLEEEHRIPFLMALEGSDPGRTEEGRSLSYWSFRRKREDVKGCVSVRLYYLLGGDTAMKFQVGRRKDYQFVGG